MTIYALSTGPGVSGVAIVRISGLEASKAIKLLTKKNLPTPRIATLRKICNINTSELIDEGIIIWFPGPESYTGEDMVEVHVHGGKAIVLALQNELSKIENFRLAEPGEFTKIALQNGKINLLKAESIGDLISAETEMQRLQAVKIMEGKSAEKFNDLREKLLKILSFVEAKIDFPEEDLPDENIKQIKKDTTEVLNKIEKILDDQKIGEIIREGFKIAIVGPTNAGKSSLLNNLSNRDVAIVSEIAGTTRDVIETHLNMDGYPVIISDTAGIRNSKDEIEKKGIKLSLDRAEKADLKLVVVDAKSIDFSGFLNDLLKDNAILVINKSDLINGELDPEVNKLDHVLISLKENINLDKLILKIKNKLKTKLIMNDDILITRERHRQHLVHCLGNLKNFLEKNDKKDFDKAAEDLRLATRNLGMIVGKVDVEEILGSIFNDFCIGK
ncbi:tRNA uridine-5-carboxymethylaminomethyl(34) synthesis GTPase MnmE [Candidatus Pelagibacter sp.]|uniref:tRNA uridine-5-carboxymethylaminomethyl(34) synthesis GTPase MnmE n=1 Tax=Candidatus Pelagibacter sp. TaxID=2024849 RepID=UPI003F84A309